VRKNKLNTGIAWSADHLGEIDDFVRHLQAHTDFGGISRSSVTEMIQRLAFALFPLFPVELGRELKADLSEEERVLLRELVKFVNS